MSEPAPESRRIDAKGLICPLPVLRARKSIKSLSPGGRLIVEATDPGAMADFKAFCDAGGHALERVEQAGDVLIFTIRRGG